MTLKVDKQGRPYFARPSAEIKAKVEESRGFGMLNPLAPNPTRDAADERIFVEMTMGLHELCTHYEIELSNPNRYLLLVFHLARDYVPNFDPRSAKPRPGRPREKLGFWQLGLVSAVDEIIKEKGGGVANACRILAKRPGQWKGQNDDSLETRYHEAKRVLNKIIAPSATKNTE